MINRCENLCNKNLYKNPWTPEPLLNIYFHCNYPPTCFEILKTIINTRYYISGTFTRSFSFLKCSTVMYHFNLCWPGPEKTKIQKYPPLLAYLCWSCSMKFSWETFLQRDLLKNLLSRQKKIFDEKKKNTSTAISFCFRQRSYLGTSFPSFSLGMFGPRKKTGSQSERFFNFGYV